MNTATTPHVTQRETARRLGVHVNTVANMLGDGRLVPVDVSNGSGRYRTFRHVQRESLEQLEAKRG